MTSRRGIRSGPTVLSLSGRARLSYSRAIHARRQAYEAGTAPSASPAPLSFERLESRLAMAVVINEFLASNVDGITDQDGDRSDWIELKNTGTAAVDLTGWYLTDDVGEPHEVATAGHEIYPPADISRSSPRARTARWPGRSCTRTSSYLDDEGEYLGLVMSDGTTVRTSSRRFPSSIRTMFATALAASASTMANVTLVGAGFASSGHLADGRECGGRRPLAEIGFNDASWTATTIGVGFDRDGSPNNALGSVHRHRADDWPDAQRTTRTTRLRPRAVHRRRQGSAHVAVRSICASTTGSSRTSTAREVAAANLPGGRCCGRNRSGTRRANGQIDPIPTVIVPVTFDSDAVPRRAGQRHQRAGVPRGEQQHQQQHHRFPDRADAARAAATGQR